MIPGELVTAPGELELNAGRETKTVRVMNTGDRPVQDPATREPPRRSPRNKSPSERAE